MPAEIAHYKMNDNAATTVVVDAMGSYNGVASVNTNLMSVAGKINTALDFPDSRKVTIADNPVFDFLGAHSITLWVKPVLGDHTFFIAKRGAPDSWQLWGRVPLQGNVVAWYNGDGASIFTNNTALSDGVWNFVVMTHDGNQTVAFYLNSVADGGSGAAPITVNTNVADVTIGEAGGDYAEGVCDDIRFYDVVLSQAEIDTLWNSGNGTEASLAAGGGRRRGILDGVGRGIMRGVA